MKYEKLDIPKETSCQLRESTRGRVNTSRISLRQSHAICCRDTTSDQPDKDSQRLTLISLCGTIGHPHGTCTRLVVAEIRWKNMYAKRSVFGSGQISMGIIYYYLAGKSRNLVFSPWSASTNIQRRRSTVKFNHGSRKTGQAAGAGGLK